MFCCNYCEKILKNNNSYKQHLIRCPLNPNKLNMDFSKTPKSIKRYKDKEFNKKNNENKIEKRLGKIITKNKICKKCWNVFFYEERELKNKHSEFCSRSCSNSRVHSVETKNKISQTLLSKSFKSSNLKSKNLFTFNCKYCWKENNKPKKWQFCNKNHYDLFLKSSSEYRKNQWIKISQTRLIKIANWTIKNANWNWWKTKWYSYLKDSESIKVQWTYELRLCKILDKQKEIGLIKDWEYTNDRFLYFDELMNPHSYLVDFKIYCDDSSFYYIEVKWFERLIDKYKWKAVRDLGYELKVLFLNDITFLENQYWL